MSEKKLLEEGAIRRFQALANIKPVGNGVINETSARKGALANTEEAVEEIKKGESTLQEKKAAHKGKKGKVQENYEEEAVEEVASGGMEEKYTEEESMEEAEGASEGGEDEVRAALEKIASGVDELVKMIGASVTMGVEAGEEEMPMGGEEEEEEEAGEEESLEEKKHTGKMHKGKKVEEVKAAEEEEEEEESLEESTDALAEELTRRVAARLMREAKKGAVAKKGGNWLAKPAHSKPASAGGKPKSPKGYKPLSASKKHGA